MHTKILKWCGKKLKIYEQIFHSCRMNFLRTFRPSHRPRKARKKTFTSGESMEIVKCTVADDNGWVTGFSVFIQREKWVKNKCPEHFLNILLVTTLYFWILLWKSRVAWLVFWFHNLHKKLLGIRTCLTNWKLTSNFSKSFFFFSIFL